VLCVFETRHVCVRGNGLRLPIERVDDAVLRTLAGDVLRAPVVLAVIDGVFAALEPRNLADELEGLRHDLRRSIVNSET
jgi:hypothetical protein